MSVIASLKKINKKLNILDIVRGEYPVISFVKKNNNNLKVNCFVIGTVSFIKNITTRKI